MEITKEKARDNLSKLIEKFEKELFDGRISDYNEEATKISFIQPFLKDVLGWDVNDRNEVSPEEKVSRNKVDYALKIDGRTKIFVEAKPPRVDINKYIEQAVGYGYNKKDVPFVLLTDFEELKLFDVTIKPNLRNPLKGLKISLHWKDYIQQFDKLWLLSKESVIRRDLDKLLLTKPKDRIQVDRAILNDLQNWQKDLAKNIFKNNPKLFHSNDLKKDADYLKDITHRILSRIIFIRFCEDRNLVNRRFLKEIFEERDESVGKNTMVFLREEFKYYNNVFDSDLFRTQEWESNLLIDFKIVKDIVLETYNPYQFDVIPLEVLGNIYEQYLSYTIKLTDHQVRYELKSGIRKAGVIYYTPEYVVDYIVKNTIGKLLQKLPVSRAKKLRILDTSCGSGTFLIKAYNEILNYYRNQKMEKVKSNENRQDELNLKDEEPEPFLTIQEKSEILKEHIFGVDIDTQAVEVTKLSLTLKMLEGETGIISGRSILPMLDKNIKCGNSLISGNILELNRYFGNDWYKIKPLNWNDDFKEIIEEGGFNVIIGNPPWVFTRDVDFGDDIKKFYLSTYFNEFTSIQKGKTKQSGKINLYALFLIQGIRLLTNGGMLGFILPNNILRATIYDVVRKHILDTCSIKQIVDLKSGVFENVTASTSILILEKNNKNDKNIVEVINNQSKDKIDVSQVFSIPQSSFLKNTSYAFNIFVSPKEEKIFEKMRSLSINLSELVNIYNGIATKKNKEGIYNCQINKKCKPLLVGKDIHRYYFNFNNRYIEYDREKLHRPREESIFVAEEKLIMQRIGGILITAYDNQKYYTFNSVNNLILKEKSPYNLKFILALLNSKLLRFYYISNFTNKSELTVNISKTYLDKLPIRNLCLDNPSEKKFYDDIVTLVNIMLELNSKIQSAKGNEKMQLQNQIEKTDNEIDNMVYKLYDITDSEKELIEKQFI